MRPETKALLIAEDASPVVSGSFGSCPWEAMMIVTMVVPAGDPGDVGGSADDVEQGRHYPELGRVLVAHDCRAVGGNEEPRAYAGQHKTHEHVARGGVGGELG